MAGVAGGEGGVMRGRLEEERKIGRPLSKGREKERETISPDGPDKRTKLGWERKRERVGARTKSPGVVKPARRCSGVKQRRFRREPFSVQPRRGRSSEFVVVNLGQGRGFLIFGDATL